MKKTIWFGTYLNNEVETTYSLEKHIADFREFAKIDDIKGGEIIGDDGNWYEWFGKDHDYQAIFIIDSNNVIDGILELVLKMFYTVRFIECRNPMEELVDDYYELHEKLENILNALKGGVK